MKICADCKWVIDPGKSYSSCSAPRALNKIDLLVGVKDATPKWQYCSVQRQPHIFACINRMCGTQGRFFEKKEQ